ncbi:MAG: hypothetical protein H6744_01590 [Deltaproteobacteria bacterium]|nr:hypothetical protein [Deltaproteobacteria bacterium]
MAEFVAHDASAKATSSKAVARAFESKFDAARLTRRLATNPDASQTAIRTGPQDSSEPPNRASGVRYAKSSEARRSAYKDLVDVTIETLEFVVAATPLLEETAKDLAQPCALELRGLIAELDHYNKLGWQVVDQTHRRIFEDDRVSAGDKVVSIFEEHTDVIVKDRRETLFGHKICLSTGPSSLVLDCVVLDGNPADSTLVEMMLDRHADILGKVPRQAAFDVGFASKANLALAKAMGVKDACFHKKRGLEVACGRSSSSDARCRR